MTRYADPRDVARKAAEWSVGQQTCRFTRFHAWPPLKHAMTLIDHGPGWYEVIQRCTRRCGVGRKATFNEQGRMLKPWRPDYSSDAAKVYRMLDADGKSLGRIDADGNAQIFLAQISDATVREVTME